MSKIRPLSISGRIISNRKVTDSCFHLVLQAPGISRQARPGQFVMVKAGFRDEPLLRRPLSVHGADAKQLELLYEVVGPATQQFSVMKPGQSLDLIGPLGNGFDLRAIAAKSGRGAARPVLVAGGMGVAPLVFLAKYLRETKPLVLIGARTASQVLCEKEFKRLGLRATIATDDASRGLGGYVTDLLEDRLRAQEFKSSGVVIYACGPQPMLSALARRCLKTGIPCQVSLEAHMACGIGACLGCVVLTKTGYKRVCKDGPVFRADELEW